MRARVEKVDVLGWNKSIICHSKHQNTVDCVAFVSEFVVLKDSTETNLPLSYKLWMLGV